jgi:hypothetical protein
MLGLSSFVAVGAVIGFLLPLRAFAIFSLVTLVAYAAFANGYTGLGLAYDVILAVISLQLGYFLAVLVHFIQHYSSNRPIMVSAKSPSN